MRRFLPILAMMFCSGTLRAGAGVYLDESRPDRLLLGNDFYEVSFSKNNGAILAVTDKRANASLTLSSRGGCLWGAVFDLATVNYVGGCFYSTSGPSRFFYAWDAAALMLTFNYSFDPTAVRRVDATVTITASSNPFFDLRLKLQNNWGDTMTRALFPSDLLFSVSEVQAAYFPSFLPGIALKPAFFAEHRSWTAVYPSKEAFADYLALDIGGGHVSVYSLINSAVPIQPVSLSFVDDETTNRGSYYAVHAFHTWTPDRATFSTVAVRVCVSQAARETILTYRSDNGIDGYRSIEAKLGSQFGALAMAPVIKADPPQMGNVAFQLWSSSFSRFASPAILHPVAYMPGGHDHNYPDFLPPDGRWGSTMDFRAMVEAAHARGFFVMPYINPTWWNPASPTLQNLPSPVTVTDIAVQNPAGQGVFQTYPPSNGGYVVSPHVPFVADRLSRLMAQWRQEVPVDLLLEDQIGSRAWLFDFNPASPTPLSYSDGWLKHVGDYAAQNLMTEDGWDRLAASEIGFHGSLMTDLVGSSADDLWGRNNWAPYPLALWLMHDKVFLYQHDLTALPMTSDAGVFSRQQGAIPFTWNLAFGTMMTYFWPGAAGSPGDTPWVDLANVLQRAVAARYAGQRFTNYDYLTPDVTRSTFAGGVSVIANWSEIAPFTLDGYTVAPG